MNELPVDFEPLLDADRRVAVDAPCTRCGYNLRTMLASAVCPECHSPVIMSLQSAWLRFSPPAWTRKLLRGLLIVLISMGITSGGCLLAMVGGLFLVASMRAGATGNVAVWSVLLIVFFISTLVLWVVGMVYFTTRDPAAIDRRVEWDARWLIRLSIVLSSILFVLYVLLMLDLRTRASHPAVAPTDVMTAFGFGTGDPVRISLGICAVLQMLLSGIILPAAFIRHVGNLLKRTPRRGLVTFARIEFWLLTCCLLLTMGGYGLLFVPGANPFMPVNVPATTTSPAVAGATLTRMSYDSQSGTWTMTTVTSMPAGPPTVVTTSMPGTFGGPPTTGPMAFVTGTPGTVPGALFIIASVVGGFGGCLLFPVGIAGLALLFMAYGAIRAECRIASPA